MARQKGSGKTAPPPKAAGKSKKKGHPMLKFFFALAVLGGLGYAAWTVPFQGHTVAERVRDALPFEIVMKHPAEPATAASQPSKPAPAAAPAEKITQADRDALNKLIPR